MRPIRLEIQGLTAYRQTVQVDFSELDLFAIWGPTGAGKSSLVDAITYALFGQVPRVGRNVRELISQGEERMKVTLEFSSDGARYRIHRSSSKRGQTPVQLERFDPATNQWLPEEDRARDVNKFIENLLGMDYDGFVRSVLLPQGQFQQFLAGEPEQRRKVLDGILRLDVYGRMQESANAIHRSRLDRADEIADRLASEYADATPEALKQANTRLTELKKRAKELSACLQALSAAKVTAERAQQALNKVRKAEEERAQTEKKLDQARRLLNEGESRLKELDERIASVDEALSENKYDPDLYIRLRDALRLVQDVEKGEGKLKELHGQLGEGQNRLKAAAQRQREAAARLEQATKEARDAEAALEGLRRAYAAAALRRSLKPGDPCPVCGRVLSEVPPERHVELDEGEKALRRAREREDDARSAATDAKRDLERVEMSLANLQNQIGDLDSDLAEKRDDLRKLIDTPASAAAIAAQVRDLETARADLDRLQKEAVSLRGARERRSREIADADKNVALLDSELKSISAEIDTLSREIEDDRAALRAAAWKNGWTDVLQALDGGGDPAPIIVRSLSDAQADLNTTQREIGAAETQVSRVENAIERAKQLREEGNQAREEASLARDLATLLRVDRFQAFVREQALRVLAEDGSERLREISHGRYDFSVQGQEFLVVDRWNGGEERSVKTLSGGETFLASLALALALAQRLPELGAGSQGRSLESLFIDEGFSHLDEDTLNVVADALEELRAGQDRMVGIVTHVSPLAERMPHRIIVHKQQSFSTISVS